MDGPFIAAAVQGPKGTVFRLHIVGIETAQGGQTQAAVVFNLRHHGAQRVHMGHHQSGIAAASQVHQHASLAGQSGGVAQAGIFRCQIIADLPGVAGGAVNSQQSV